MTNGQEALKRLRKKRLGTGGEQTGSGKGVGSEGETWQLPQASRPPPPSAHTLAPSEAFPANTKDERLISKWILHSPSIIPCGPHT